MPKRWIGSDELYPFYTLETKERYWVHGRPIEISEQDIAEYTRVYRQFNHWQRKIQKLWAKERDRPWLEQQAKVKDLVRKIHSPKRKKSFLAAAEKRAQEIIESPDYDFTNSD